MRFRKGWKNRSGFDQETQYDLRRPGLSWISLTLKTCSEIETYFSCIIGHVRDILRQNVDI